VNREILAEISKLVDEVLQKEQEIGFASLNGMRQGVGHFVAEQIVFTSDPSLLDGCPDWIKDQVFEYVRLYQEEGEVAIYSSVGKADHTEMARSLSNLLCAK
jgi:hypothetical protein